LIDGPAGKREEKREGPDGGEGEGDGLLRKKPPPLEHQKIDGKEEEAKPLSIQGKGKGGRGPYLPASFRAESRAPGS